MTAATPIVQHCRPWLHARFLVLPITSEHRELATIRLNRRPL